MECYSDRLIFVKISAKPVDNVLVLALVHVHMPTTDHDDDKIKFKNVRD